MNGNGEPTCCGPGYASPAEAIKAPRETLLYSIAIYTGTGIQKPDYLATIDNGSGEPDLFAGDPSAGDAGDRR